MIIKLEHVYKRYSKSEIFQDFTHEFIIDNSVLAILGPNGAGKTTLMKLISGIVCQYKGEIKVLKNELGNNKTYIEWAHKNISYLSPDERYLSFKNNCIDNILYYGIIKGIDSQVIMQNLNDFMKYIDCQSYIHKRIEQLSTGQKKVIKLLSVFCTGIPILLLDEPTVGLDVDTREILIQVIKIMINISKSTIIISTHDLEFASSISTKQIFIFDGEVKGIQAMIATTEELKIQYNMYKLMKERKIE